MRTPNILNDQERRKQKRKLICEESCVPPGRHDIGDVHRCEHERIWICTDGRWWKVLRPWLQYDKHQKAKRALDGAK